MSTDSTNPLPEIYSANALLFQLLTQLAQQASQEWTTLFQQTLATDGTDSCNEIGELLGVSSFPALLALQANIVRRHWEKYQNTFQPALQSAVERQNARITSIAEIVGEWQRSIPHAIDVHGTGGYSTRSWFELLNRLSALSNGSSKAITKGDSVEK